MKKNYIGIANTFHDSSVAIVNSEGKVVFAQATERYLQNKRAIHAPADQFINIGRLVEEYCEPGAELIVANTWSSNAGAMGEQATRLVSQEEAAWRDENGRIPDLIFDKLAFRKFAIRAQINAAQLANITLRYELSQLEQWRSNTDFKVRCYDHHLTHAATACFTAPFASGVCAIVDGYGEGCSSQCFRYENGRISSLTQADGQGFLSASLGTFYMIICDVCGFGYFRGEEWKVMGLAAYGKFNQQYYDIMKPMMEVQGLSITACSPLKYNQRLRKLYSLKRKPDQSALEMADLAYTGQYVYSEILFEYLNNLYKAAPSDQVILGGGSFLNSWANGEITKFTPFRRSHIFSAPGDDGNSLGAALLAYYEDHPDKRPENSFQSPYLGSAISIDSIEKFKEFGGLNQYITEYPGTVHKKAAELLAQGKIIGWIQGRAEFGPRALGNRSILADPRRADCQEEINQRVKFREEFRPFAPSVLHQYAEEYFIGYEESPYMERTLKYHQDAASKVPGVVHVNQSGRLQTVKKEWNEKYYNLIEAFYQLTGVPVILNTSFNVMGKPISHSLEDVLSVFFTSGLDALIINDLIIEKPDPTYY